MLRTLSRVSELPIVVRQLQKVRKCNAAHAVTNKTIVTVTNTKQQHTRPRNSSNGNNNNNNTTLNSSSGNNNNHWTTRQQQQLQLQQKQLRFDSRRSYSSSFFGLFQNAAQAGVAKTNNYATEATVQVNRVSIQPNIHSPHHTVKRLHNMCVSFFIIIFFCVFCDLIATQLQLKLPVRHAKVTH